MSTSRRGLASIVSAFIVSAVASMAHAGPVNLQLGAPLVNSDTITLTYTYNGSNGGTLVATGGVARNINGITPIPNGVFNLIANLTVTGTGTSQVVTPVSGSLSVTGSGHQYFISSNIKNIFGFTTDGAGTNVSNNETLEFVFQPVSGELPGGNPVGVSLTGLLSPTYTINSAFFTNSFNNTGLTLATSMTAPLQVPEPASLGIGLLAAVPLLLRRRKA